MNGTSIESHNAIFELIIKYIHHNNAYSENFPTSHPHHTPNITQPPSLSLEHHVTKPTETHNDINTSQSTPVHKVYTELQTETT
jgi:hypothetical protein